MGSGKRKRLEATVAAIQQRWGRKALRPGDEARRAAAAAPRIPPGFAELDGVLAGGIPRGRLTELLGSPTSGKVVASAQAAGDTAAYVDLSAGLMDRWPTGRCWTGFWGAGRGLGNPLADRVTGGGELRLSLLLESGAEWSEQQTLRQATANPERLALALVSLLERAKVESGVVAVTASLAGLAPAIGQQLDLFTHGGGQEGRLRALLPDLLARYGRAVSTPRP